MTRTFVPVHDVDEALPACTSLLAQTARLTGPGSNRIRGLVRRLTLELELRAQDERRLGAEVLRSHERLALPRRRAPRVALVRRSATSNGAHALVEDCRQIAAVLGALTGHAGFGVHAVLRQLVVALELYEQDQLRLRTESLRQELLAPRTQALLLPAAPAPEEMSR